MCTMEFSRYAVGASTQDTTVQLLLSIYFNT